jgi:hypothetical protein
VETSVSHAIGMATAALARNLYESVAMVDRVFTEVAPLCEEIAIWRV